MMYQDIMKVNQHLDSLPESGIRIEHLVDAFRQLYPEGCIETEIKHFDDVQLIVRAVLTDEQRGILSTAHSISFDHDVESAENYAVARAIGLLGIGKHLEEDS